MHVYYLFISSFSFCLCSFLFCQCILPSLILFLWSIMNVNVYLRVLFWYFFFLFLVRTYFSRSVQNQLNKCHSANVHSYLSYCYCICLIYIYNNVIYIVTCRIGDGSISESDVPSTSSISSSEMWDDDSLMGGCLTLDNMPSWCFGAAICIVLYYMHDPVINYKNEPYFI